MIDIGQKFQSAILGHKVKFRKNHVYTSEGTVLMQSSWNFVRLFILIKSRPGPKMGHVGSKLGHKVNS